MILVRTYWVTASHSVTHKEYRKKFGECNVPAEFTTNNLARNFERTGVHFD
jgi:hypothetical protein